MNSAFLAATAAAAVAGLSGFGIRAQNSVRIPDSSVHEDNQDAGVFSQWLTADAPECVPVSQIGSVSHVTKLTAEQFQFVRALYIAIPPISRQLPPGDSAVVGERQRQGHDRACRRRSKLARASSRRISFCRCWLRSAKAKSAMIGEPI